GSLPAHRSAAFVSGRPGFELVQKAVVAGIPLVAGVGAPTHLAVDLARELDVTLIGFLRPTSFNVYAVPERIVERAAAVAPGLPPGE
ncbi:MAG TPA: formate dehydrogenase accessory sulfurtransferase FdhD, partial [Thermoplasmata archaeon]|nr:formate dehydrogenase accessory sulfurtransferase FdhD [Thermoplasmata archaeon]